MPSFLETTFGPVELEIIDIAFQSWKSRCGLAKDDPDAIIAAEICINLFREGHRTLPELVRAMEGHKALGDISAAYE
ncbi:hypothetical protein SAMN03159496_05074 [Rhizobium sp. NFR07]|uniref:hypothetical protein n=1 Tax=Rhizobium sp. NFR07 TaxID=1566262 RepID=UPI0008E8EC40|nr:hypothetical protein [Rhizobium sp. NFR07]SFB55743.1 hypothetical protein SAMN03159496_05074 [Rhizobium sp. NFR07]